MNMQAFATVAISKDNYTSISQYAEFCQRYLDFVAKRGNLQATIVSQNENHDAFFQYKEDGDFEITRPINTQLMYTVEGFAIVKPRLVTMLQNARELKGDDRKALNNAIYTIQQTVGLSLDALPAGASNTAKKINGDLFERFIRFVIQELGVPCRAGVMQIPVMLDGEEYAKMSYQHDLIGEGSDGSIQLLGSIKTSSKDRIDKIFIDKFLYSKVTDTVTLHIAVFLNDVQRKKSSQEGRYGINSTSLPGHFKGYTVKLNPLDGVYYCDMRPNMRTEKCLKDYIRTFDVLLCEDIWRFIQ